jgi:RIO-like serine/threonine protein kinase
VINIGTYAIQEYYFIKKFHSKRNNVWLIKDKENNKKMVYKKFSSIKTFRNELDIHYYLFNLGCNVPKIYQIGLDYIIMEYIHSITLCDYILKCENQNKRIDMKIILSFIKLLEEIYTSGRFKNSKMILHDTNLRNFLVCGEQVYIIDFEETIAEKNILTDVTGFIAFFITYNPCFSQWKLEELQRLINFLDRRYDKIYYVSIKIELVKWIEFLGKRRNIYYNEMEGYNKFLTLLDNWEFNIK